MDEQTWHSSTNLQEMLAHLRETSNVNRRKAGRRKLRLLTCSLARVVWDRLSEPSRALIREVELLLDGRSTEEECQIREQAVQQYFMSQAHHLRPGNADGIVYCVIMTRSLEQMTVVAASQLGMMMVDVEGMLSGAVNPLEMGDVWQQAIADSQRRAAELAREIFGNPFRPLPKRKFPAEVRGLAQACFDDASHYPLLADALADLGEEEAAEHCRRADHVRGCHVADWVTGRA